MPNRDFTTPDIVDGVVNELEDQGITVDEVSWEGGVGEILIKNLSVLAVIRQQSARTFSIFLLDTDKVVGDEPTSVVEQDNKERIASKVIGGVNQSVDDVIDAMVQLILRNTAAEQLLNGRSASVVLETFTSGNAGSGAPTKFQQTLFDPSRHYTIPEDWDGLVFQVLDDDFIGEGEPGDQLIVDRIDAPTQGRNDLNINEGDATIYYTINWDREASMDWMRFVRAMNQGLVM